MKMKIIADSAPNLLRLLLLAQFFAHSASRPAHSSPLCSSFKTMISKLRSLKIPSKTLHGLTDSELQQMGVVDHKLHNLPSMDTKPDQINSMKLNESLSQLYLNTQAFKVHVEWLKTARENVSLPYSQAAGAASRDLLLLSNLTSAALQQINMEIPQPPSPSLPVVSTTFDVVMYSIEISQRLQSFCNLSHRVLLHLRSQSSCPR